MEQVYIPTLKANYMIWPLVQILNFRVIPLQFQLVSTLNLSLPFCAADVFLAVAIRIDSRDLLDVLYFFGEFSYASIRIG